MAIKSIQELLSTSTGTEGSLLIQKKIYDTLIEAVEKRRISREFAAIQIGPSGIPGSSIDINLVTPDSMTIRQIAEGAAVPIDAVEYTSFNMKPLKYAVRILITKEMQEDGKWDLITHNLKYAGREMGENETSLTISDAFANGTNSVSGGAAVTIANITRAIQYLEDSDYNATTMFVGPEVANDIRQIDTFAESNKSGTNEMRMTGFIGRIYGMDVIRVSGNLQTTTTAYIIDREHAYVIAEKRPLTVEKYDDTIHDMSGAVVTQRLKIRQLRAAAIVTVTSS